MSRPIRILLVEDNEADVRLTREALRDSKIANEILVAKDGVEALRVLRQTVRDPVSRPDLVLLDLNLPRMDGREVLAAIKTDATLKDIPIVVLTTSRAEADVLESYQLHANCYIHKPVDLDQFLNVVHSIEDFWLSIVRLPAPASGLPARS